MRLLLGQNLSPRLVLPLADLYPRSLHVRDVGLAAAEDGVVWAYGAEHGLTIVSKDAGSHRRSVLLGRPPKLVWIRRDNCTTDTVAAVLREHHADLLRFERDETAAFLALS